MAKVEHNKVSLKSFYKYEATCLGMMALWPLKVNVTQKSRYIHIIHFYAISALGLLSLDLCCVIQLIKYLTNLNEVIKVFFIFATSLAVSVKLISIKRNNHLYQLWLNTIQASTFQPLNATETKIIQQKLEIVRRVRIIYTCISLLALTNILRYRKNELPISIYMPFNADNDVNYILLYLYQCITASFCCCINVGFDLYVTTAMIHLKSQVDILCHRLENLNDRDNLNRSISEKLKNTVIYYDEILKLAKLIEHLITVPISIQVACSVLVLVANLYVLSFQSDHYSAYIKVLSYQICMLMQIYLLCYYPGEVTNNSQLIPHALYSSNWFKWTQSQRKFTLLLLQRFRVPIKFHSINPTYAFNVAAFSSIVNSSYSYFALLKRFND